MKNLFIIIVCCICLGCSDDSSDQSTNPQFETTVNYTTSELEAYQILAESGEFASTAVGIAGSVPRQVPAFQELLNSKHSAELFADLQEEESLAGQLYGLCGLYLVDKEQFESVISEYQNNPSTVQTFFGCILSETPLSAIVPLIEDGTWPSAYQNCQIETVLHPE